MPSNIEVNMGEFKIANDGSTLTASSVGSCVAIALYDPKLKQGGLAHIMLPATPLKENSRAEKSMGNSPGKFADTAIEAMLHKLLSQGSKKENLRAKMAGGGNMFPQLTNSSFIDIGEQNISKIKERLKKHQIRLVGEDIKGAYGRTVEFCLKTGIMTIKTKL